MTAEVVTGGVTGGVGELPTTARLRAPLPRLLRAELRFMLRRPRTLVAFGLLALVPVVAAVGVSVAAGASPPGRGGDVFDGIASMLEGNALVLPVFVLMLSMPMLLPLVTAMWSADAIAGEASTGGLRNLLLAPVGRPRLLAVKAFAVAVLCLLAATLVAVVSVVVGMVVLGGGGMLTMSGTTLPFGASLARVGLLVLLVTAQLWAVAAVALAISACTDHPLVVLAAATGGIIVFTVLGSISALAWLHPVLLPTGWTDLADVARDPMPTEALTEGVLRAACYVVIGYSLALARMVTRDG